MPKIKGICTNIDGCDKAASREIQEVEKSDFVCQECGRPLKECKEQRGSAADSEESENSRTNGGRRRSRKGPRNDNNKLVILGIAALLALGCIVGIVYWYKHRPITPDDSNWPPKGPDHDTVVVEKIDTIVKHDTIQIHDTVMDIKQLILSNGTVTKADTIVIKVDVNQTTDQPKTPDGKPQGPTGTPKTSTLKLSYGNYTGEVKNGYPHGMGRLTYTTARQINKYDPKKRMANVGDYVSGEFVNGYVVNAKHFNAKGEQIDVLMVGVSAGNDHDAK